MAVNQQQPMQEVHSQLKLCLTNWSQNASGTPKSRSATSGENLEKSSLESDIATSETAHSHGETVIKPSLRNYGGRPGHQFCSGCYNRLYGAGYTCQECKDFYLCPLCMESELQPHFEHRFRSLVYGSVFLRKHVGTSNDDWNDMSKEDSVSSDREVTGGILETPEPPMMEGYACSPELTFLVKTRYKYVYLRSGGEKIGELESFTPRLPSRRKIVGRDIPVIEKIITIRTALPKEASLAEMQAVDFVPSPSDCHVSINSPMLLNALRAVVAYYPGWSLNEGSLVYCRYDSTICLLSHHRHQLLRYKHEHPSTHSEEYVRECNAHIDEVIRFLDLETDLAPKRLEDQMCGDDPTVTYDQLEMLFKPGLEIYAWNDDQLGAFIITSTIKDVRDSKSEEFLHIVAWNLDFDGTDLGRACRNIFIKKFKDQQKIRCLPCFPTSLKFETWGGKPTRQRLIERGQKFFELCKGPNYMEVTGFTRDLPKRKYSKARLICDASCEPWREATHRPSDNGIHEPYFTDDGDRDKNTRPLVGNVLRETINSFPGCTCEDCRTLPGLAVKPHPYSQWDKISRTKLSLEEQQYFMCSGQVYGYILKERQWRLLDVEDLQQPELEPNLINELVLENESRKELIKAICSNYTSREPHDTYSADFIHGKGEGHIFLLHGPPGVGKTLTAECVAEYTGRPLLPLTGGDIGSTASEVENNLRSFLRRGQDWNAVVLLDEADVYLSARDRNNIERNSVVSVFLREIEYYRGILFLTTNQIGQFDEAITSRVHISLHFQPFNPQSRRKIWENNIERLRKERKDIKIDYNVPKYIKKDLLHLSWNGREIRNAFQTAVSLALFAARDGQASDVELTTKHIEQVVEMSNNFKTYIDSTLDADAAARAKFNKIRNDEFTAEQEQL